MAGVINRLRPAQELDELERGEKELIVGNGAP
jgi:hypothetical protein